MRKVFECLGIVVGWYLVVGLLVVAIFKYIMLPNV